MARVASESIVVGRILRAHGVKGEVSVLVESDVPGRFAVGSRLTAVAGRSRRQLEIVAVRRHQRRLLVRFLGVEAREEADSLRGSSLEITADRVPPSAPGSYYFFELVGCRCEARAAGPLGRVVDVIEDGGGLLLEVVSGQKSRLIPFVERFLVAVDIEAQRIELDLPPGLIEICESRS